MMGRKKPLVRVKDEKEVAPPSSTSYSWSRYPPSSSAILGEGMELTDAQKVERR